MKRNKKNNNKKTGDYVKNKFPKSSFKIFIYIYIKKKLIYISNEIIQFEN